MASSSAERKQAKTETKGGYPAGGVVNQQRPAPKFPARPPAARDKPKDG